MTSPAGPGGTPVPLSLEYTDGGGGLKRPYLVIDLKGPHGHAQVQGLIDSGADWSVLPKGFEAIFGYQASDLVPEADGSQVGGPLKMWTAPAPFLAVVTGLHREFELYPRFVENATSVLWGRLDFMAVYDVMLMERIQHFALMIDPALDYLPDAT